MRTNEGSRIQSRQDPLLSMFMDYVVVSTIQMSSTSNLALNGRFVLLRHRKYESTAGM